MAKYKRRYDTSRRHGAAGPSTRDLEEKEIANLEARIKDEKPDRGYVPSLHQKVSFRALQISDATMRGLEQGHKTKQFTTMTDIQNACIPHALAGRDVLGAARTGSGKTLAFLIPLIEKLYRERFTPQDGPGAIVLSPTRELAVQIFEVLRIVGCYHNLSAGLLVGGKKEFSLEQSRVGRTNILIATPGRLLQHLEQTPNFDTGLLSMLVLDEADRILDLGFRDQMERILSYLPPGAKAGGSRQTLLFSATQTKRVADLAALSLDRPEYIGVHDKESSATPESLEQSMIVVPLQHKLDAVFSFIKSHLRKKTIIFFSSCSQVRHVWEVFCTLQPGVPLMALHGKINQERRTKIYFDFLQRPHAVLFATDVAARGLDFPNVDWVVQADAPEDKEMYIHRVGRTARYNSGGRSLLVLLPSEEFAMAKLLDASKIRIKKLSINPTKTVLVSQRVAGIVASKPELNLLAKKAFKSYLRSVHLMPNKEVFPGVSELPVDEYATSLGLASTPSVRFLKKIKNREEERKKKNVDYRLQKLKEEIKAERLQKKIQRLGGTEPPFKKKDGKRKRVEDASSESDDGLLVVKKKHRWGDDDVASGKDGDLPTVHLHEASKSRHPKKIRIEGSTGGVNRHVVFSDDGEELDMEGYMRQDSVEVNAAIGQDELAVANEEYLQKVRERLNQTKEQDKIEEKERIRKKHQKRRIKEKGKFEIDEEDGQEEMAVTLGQASDASSSDESTEDGSIVGASDAESQSDDDTANDIKAQEDLALAMLRNKSK